MSDLPDFGFAPPPWDASNGLMQLKRALRDMRLTERGNAFELRGKRVIELVAGEGEIAVRVARKLALTPEWDKSTLRSAADQRKCLDELKKRLERWEREE